MSEEIPDLVLKIECLWVLVGDLNKRLSVLEAEKEIK